MNHGWQIIGEVENKALVPQNNEEHGLRDYYILSTTFWLGDLGQVSLSVPQFSDL